MPAAIAVDVETRISELVEARRPVLEELVAAAVDRALVELVDQELEQAIARLAERNGNFPPAGTTVPVEPTVEAGTDVPSSSSTPPPATSTCSRCGAEPRLPGRTIGRRCKQADDLARRARRREQRETAAAGAQDSPDGDESRPGDLTAAAAAGEHAARLSAPSTGRFRHPPAVDELERREQRRALIERARANGVDQETRDGRTFAVVHLEPEGVTAQKLAERNGNRAGTNLDPAELERWLTAEGLADLDDDGRLRPTGQAIMVGGALAPS